MSDSPNNIISFSDSKDSNYRKGSPLAKELSLSKSKSKIKKTRKPHIRKTRDDEGNRILPISVVKKIPGTIAFMVSRMQGGNEALYNYASLAAIRDPRIDEMLKEYDSFSEAGRKDIRLFDKLCRRHKISVPEFWGAVSREMISYNRSMAVAMMAQLEEGVVTAIAKHAKKERNLGHAELFTRMTGLDPGKNPSVVINNQQNTQINNGIRRMPSLEDTTLEMQAELKEERKREIEEIEQKQENQKALPPASEDFIDAAYQRIESPNVFTPHNQ